MNFGSSGWMLKKTFFIWSSTCCHTLAKSECDCEVLGAACRRCWVFVAALLAAGALCVALCDRQAGTSGLGGCRGWVGMLSCTRTLPHQRHCLSETCWDGAPPTRSPQTQEIERIQSANQLAISAGRVHPSFHHLRRQVLRLYLFINPTYSLFIAAILLQQVFAEVEMFPTCKIESWLRPPLKLLNGQRKMKRGAEIEKEIA